MFRAWCEKWERDVLIWPSHVETITNTDRGILLTYECGCGEHAEMITGAASAKTVTVHAG